MTEVNLNERTAQMNAAVAEAIKPKRIRKVIPKVTKTAVQITEELATLKEEVAELETAIAAIPTDNALYPIAEKAFQDKKDELEKAFATVYTI